MPQKDVRFAIITPVFNTKNYLPECINSILTQSYPNFCAFLIDDGSTDGSAEILDKYAKTDPRLKVVHKINGGVSSARNIALELIEADKNFDYVLFLDSDDILDQNCLHIISNYLKKDENKILFFGWISFDKQGKITKITNQHTPIILDSEQTFCFTFNPFNQLQKKTPAHALFLANNAIPLKPITGLRFDPRLKTGEDQEFKMQAIMNCNGSVIISDTLLQYRLRKSSLSHSNMINIRDPLSKCRFRRHLPELNSFYPTNSVYGLKFA